MNTHATLMHGYITTIAKRAGGALLVGLLTTAPTMASDNDALELCKDQPRLARSADLGEPAAVIAARELINSAQRSLQNGDTADATSALTAAANACKAAITPRRARYVSVFSCIGDARFLNAPLGTSSARDDYAVAYCAYRTASELAERADGDAQAALVSAFDQQGASLAALVSLDGGGAAHRYFDEAVQAYENADIRAPSVSRRLRVGDLHQNVGDYDTALAWYRRGLAQAEPASTGQAGAAARTEQGQARLKLAQILAAKNDPQLNGEIQQELDTVIALAETAPAQPQLLLEARFERGLHAYYRTQDRAAAEAMFKDVELATDNGVGGFGPSASAIRAEALYLLASMEFENGDALSAALAHAEEAARIGSNPRYDVLQCLLHIVRGGQTFWEGGSDADCDLGDGAEARLLRGIYHIRRAGYVSNVGRLETQTRVWRRHLDAADAAFTNGALAATNLPPTAATFQWPGMSAPLPLETMLNFGSSVIILECQGLRSAQIQRIKNETTSGEPFFARYNGTC